MKRIVAHSLPLFVVAFIVILSDSSDAFISSHGIKTEPRYENKLFKYEYDDRVDIFMTTKRIEMATISTKKIKSDIEQQKKGKTKSTVTSTIKKKNNTALKKRGSSGPTTSSSATSDNRKLKFEEVEEPVHFWSNSTDTLVYKDDGSVKMVKFTVQGNPVPLARHRTFRGFIFNPSAKKQQQFASVVLNMLPSSCFLNSTSIFGAKSRSCESVIPIFKEDETISVKILCRMKRPKNHFTASVPGPGRLKKSAPNSLLVTRTDVDNLAKFVLDSLNQIIYVDDRQIASLQVFKVYDDGHYCSGATDVIIQSLTQVDLQIFHQNFQNSTDILE